MDHGKVTAGSKERSQEAEEQKEVDARTERDIHNETGSRLDNCHAPFHVAGLVRGTTFRSA
jgi:hypothetical protein